MKFGQPSLFTQASAEVLCAARPGTIRGDIHIAEESAQNMFHGETLPQLVIVIEGFDQLDQWPNLIKRHLGGRRVEAKVRHEEGSLGWFRGRWGGSKTKDKEIATLSSHRHNLKLEPNHPNPTNSMNAPNFNRPLLLALLVNERRIHHALSEPLIETIQLE